MDEINWSNDFYSYRFSLDFDNLFSAVDLEILNERNPTVGEVENTTNQTSERVVFRETTTETNNLPVPDESLLLQTSYSKRYSNRQKIKTQTEVQQHG